MKRTDKNISKLAQEVLDSWDMDTLQGYALQQLEKAYKEDEHLFMSDVNLMFS